MTTPNTTPSSHGLPFYEKLTLVKRAWKTLATETPFSGMTVSEFEMATINCRDCREGIAILSASLKGAISDRNKADQATNALINRVVDSVKSDAAHGRNSALYRAMGFVPLSERKASSRTGVPVAPAGAGSHPGLMQRLALIITAWTEIATDSQFAGMNVTMFKTLTNPSAATRAVIAGLNANLTGGFLQRREADLNAKDLLHRVVAAVKADPAFGPDCALYRAMGYIPTSERRSPHYTPPTPAA